MENDSFCCRKMSVKFHQSLSQSHLFSAYVGLAISISFSTEESYSLDFFKATEVLKYQYTCLFVFINDV